MIWERVTLGGGLVLMVIGGLAFDNGQNGLGVVLALIGAVAAIAVVALHVTRGMHRT